MTVSILTTVAIHAKEGMEVAIVDLPEAFLHADNEDDVVMFMRGRLTELMVMVAPIHYRQEGAKSSLCKSPESPLWYASKCIAFLSQVEKGLRGYVIQGTIHV